MAGVTFSVPEVLATAAAAVAVAGGAAGLYSWCRNLYRRSIGSRQDHARRFNQLATGVTTRYVEERFGAPAFVRNASFSLDSGATVKLISRVYYTRHAWLEILTNEDEAVVRFSITVTDPRFRFRVRDLTFGVLKAALGYSRFSEIDSRTVEGRNLIVTPQGHVQYSESFHGGLAAYYQKFVLSYNRAGTGSFGSMVQVMEPPYTYLFFQEGNLLLDPNLDAKKNPKYALDTAWAQQFRAQTVVNTLAVFNQNYITPSDSQEGSGPPLARFLISPGPDANQVGVLVADAQTRRKRRELISEYEQIRSKFDRQNR